MIRWSRPATSEAERRRREGFARWMEVYWCADRAWWEAAEYETMLYATELAEYSLAHPRPTLKAYMIATRTDRNRKG